MSEELPDTVESGIKSWLGAGAFTLVLVGGDVVKESHVQGIGLWVGAALVILALPVYLSAAWWRVLKPKLNDRVVAALNAAAVTSPWWLRAILIFALALILAQFLHGWPFVRQSDVKSDWAALQSSWAGYTPPKQIVGQDFYNQEVPLDGVQYVNCTFHNVTFVYDAITPFQIAGGKIFPPVFYRTNNPAIEASWTLLLSTGAMHDVGAFGPGAKDLKRPEIHQLQPPLPSAKPNP